MGGEEEEEKGEGGEEDKIAEERGMGERVTPGLDEEHSTLKFLTE